MPLSCANSTGRATFSYDGMQYSGEVVQAITPNEQFYCVTKNVIDPRGERMQSGDSRSPGLVENAQRYNLDELKSLTP